MGVIGKATLWEGKFLRAVRIRYSTLTNSCDTPQERDWEAIERINCEGVVGIVPLTDDAHVIMIRQFRPPVGRHVVELPAGLVDKGESAEEAAQRELIEETGYKAGRMTFLGEGPMSSGASSEVLRVFVATGLTHVGLGQRDETEMIEVLMVPLDKLRERLLSFEKRGDYVDLKIYGLVRLAEESLKAQADS